MLNNPNNSKTFWSTLNSFNSDFNRSSSTSSMSSRYGTIFSSSDKIECQEMSQMIFHHPNKCCFSECTVPVLLYLGSFMIWFRLYWHALVSIILITPRFSMILIIFHHISIIFTMIFNPNHRGPSDSITDILMLSNSAGAQNIFCLGLCGRDICPKSYA